MRRAPDTASAVLEKLVKFWFYSRRLKVLHEAINYVTSYVSTVVKNTPPPSTGDVDFSAAMIFAHPAAYKPMRSEAANI